MGTSQSRATTYLELHQGKDQSQADVWKNIKMSTRIDMPPYGRQFVVNGVMQEDQINDALKERLLRWIWYVTGIDQGNRFLNYLVRTVRSDPESHVTGYKITFQMVWEVIASKGTGAVEETFGPQILLAFVEGYTKPIKDRDIGLVNRSPIAAIVPVMMSRPESEAGETLRTPAGLAFFMLYTLPMYTYQNFVRSTVRDLPIARKKTASGFWGKALAGAVSLVDTFQREVIPVPTPTEALETLWLLQRMAEHQIRAELQGTYNLTFSHNTINVMTERDLEGMVYDRKTRHLPLSENQLSDTRILAIDETESFGKPKGWFLRVGELFTGNAGDQVTPTEIMQAMGPGSEEIRPPEWADMKAFASTYDAKMGAIYSSGVIMSNLLHRVPITSTEGLKDNPVAKQLMAYVEYATDMTPSKRPAEFFNCVYRMTTALMQTIPEWGAFTYRKHPAGIALEMKSPLTWAKNSCWLDASLTLFLLSSRVAKLLFTDMNPEAMKSPKIPKDQPSMAPWMRLKNIQSIMINSVAAETSRTLVELKELLGADFLKLVPSQRSGGYGASCDPATFFLSIEKIAQDYSPTVFDYDAILHTLNIRHIVYSQIWTGFRDQGGVMKTPSYHFMVTWPIDKGGKVRNLPIKNDGQTMSESGAVIKFFTPLPEVMLVNISPQAADMDTMRGITGCSSPEGHIEFVTEDGVSANYDLLGGVFNSKLGHYQTLLHTVRGWQWMDSGKFSDSHPFPWQGAIPQLPGMMEIPSSVGGGGRAFFPVWLMYERVQN